MKNNIIVGCDLHNTLLLSNEAWIKAFISLNSKLDINEISNFIYSKKSRKEMARLYNIDYNVLLNTYHKNCIPNIKLLNFIKELKVKGFPIVLISSSSEEKVKKDLEKLKEYISFDKIYTKETFSKSVSKDWDMVIKEYRAKFMVYIGNDYDEDIIHNDKVISILSGHFFTELKKNGFLEERGK
ncbi:MAG: hypothetical protein IJE04_02010 [Bacilli bacterium]|nr:hypothetical protein [Bacilli bacterium]